MPLIVYMCPFSTKISMEVEQLIPCDAVLQVGIKVKAVHNGHCLEEHAALFLFQGNHLW